MGNAVIAKRTGVGSAALAGKADLVGGTVPVAQLPPASASAAGTQSTDDFSSRRFVGTAGAGNLAANKLCYYDATSSTLLHAKADAVATSRKIMGVTTAAVTAAASATLIRRGPARITAAAGCTPVIGAEAYLSGATAGCVASALSGTIYPRQVGYFLEGAAAGDGTVLVDLVLDDARDDAREWIVSDTILTGTATALSYPVTRALWRELETRVMGCGSGSAAIVAYPFDVAADCEYLLPGYMAHECALGQCFTMKPAYVMDARLRDVWNIGAVWDWESYTRGRAGNAISRGHGSKDGPAEAIGLDGGVDPWLQIGTRVLISGKVRL